VRLAITHAYCWPEVRRGAERIIVETSRALAGRGHDVTVFTSAWDGGRATENGVRWVRLRRMRHTSWTHERNFGRRLLPLLAAGRFDAVHSLGPRDAAASVRAARVHRRRVTVYENMGVPRRSWWDHQPEKDDHELLVREADVYGCMSQYALDELVRDYGRVGTRIPGGVDLDEFVSGAPKAAAPTLLFSGAISEPRKGVALLLDALALVAESEPSVRLWLSGPGDPEPLLAAAPQGVRERTDVLPVGSPDEQAARYASAWVTVLPSTDEVFGMVLVESLACGTPLVGLRHAAVPEVVTADVGRLAEPHDARSLADACLSALELARVPGTADVCRSAAEPYDWTRSIAPMLEELYEGG
jgi:phosphatidylinositol alpha-mannosyltransferase